MVYKSGQIFPPFCHNPRVWQTDRQTDRRTDGQTEFSSLYRVCITCSAVKMLLTGQSAIVSMATITMFQSRESILWRVNRTYRWRMNEWRHSDRALPWSVRPSVRANQQALTSLAPSPVVHAQNCMLNRFSVRTRSVCNWFAQIANCVVGEMFRPTWSSTDDRLHIVVSSQLPNLLTSDDVFYNYIPRSQLTDVAMKTTTNYRLK